MNKKKIVWMLLFVVIAGISIYAVSMQGKNVSLDELLQDIREADKRWLFLAAAGMVGFIGFEAKALNCIIYDLTGRKSKAAGILYASSDIYFSAVTPSATGGQPVSALFMIRDGIPAVTATISLLANLIMYTLALIFLGAAIFLTKAEVFFCFDIFSRTLIVIGILILIGLAILFYMLLWHETFLHDVGIKLIRLLSKMHILRRGEEREKKFESTISEFKDCTKALSGKKMLMGKLFLYNLLQRLSQISVTASVYMAIGGKLRFVAKVLAIQGMTTIGSGCVPIPGAMGAADYLLLDGLRNIPVIEDVARLELLSRGISFYVCVILSAILMIIGYGVQKRRRKT